MGYKIKDITTIDEPKMVSLSDNANYVQFASKTNTGGKFVEVAMTVYDNTIVPPTNISEDEKQKFVAQNSTIAFVEYTTNNEHIIKGTTNVNNVNSSTYFISESGANITASNIKDCLMKNNYWYRRLGRCII